MIPSTWVAVSLLLLVVPESWRWELLAQAQGCKVQKKLPAGKLQSAHLPAHSAPGRGVQSPLSERMRSSGGHLGRTHRRISHFLGAPPEGATWSSSCWASEPPRGFRAALCPLTSDRLLPPEVWRSRPITPCAAHQNTALGGCPSLASQEPGEGLGELGPEKADTFRKAARHPLPCSWRAMASPAPFRWALISPSDYVPDPESRHRGRR